MFLPPASQALGAEGDFDRTFGGDGVVEVGGPGGFSPAPSVIDDASRIVSVSRAGTVFRYLADGTRDLSFADEGEVRLSVGSTPIRSVIDLSAYPGGNVLLAAQAEFPGSGFEDLLLRLNENGELDQTFGDGGVVRTGIENLESEVRALAVDSAGNIAYAPRSDAVLKFLPNGEPDPSFSDDGRWERSDNLTSFEAPILRPDGRLLVAEDDFLLQLLPSGAVDPSYGQAGQASLCCGTYPTNRIAELALAPDGTTYAQVGSCFFFIGPSPGENCSGRLAKVAPDGTVDESFGEGLATNPINVNGTFDPAGLTIDSQGRILAAGRSRIAIPLRVARIFGSGTLDGSYGGGGVAGAFPNSCTFNPFDLNVDASDRVVVSGTACRRHVLVRLSAGDEDPNADGDGFVDAEDRCDQFPGPTRSGCPIVARRLVHFRISRGIVSGLVLDSPGDRAPANECQRHRRVLLVRRTERGSRVVDRTRSSRSGGWRLRFDPPLDRHIVKVAAGFGGERAFCAGASRPVRRG